MDGEKIFELKVGIFIMIGVAILFHEGSTIVVVLNALRLLGYGIAKR